MNNRQNQRGAAALLIAASLFLLFGFAAIAVDVGSAKDERRQDQSAADVGALAAAQFAKPSAGCSGAGCLTSARTNGANEAIAVANATLDDPSLAVWASAAECGTPPAGFTASAVSPCVAFNANLQRAWVKIPTIENDTFFARILGAVAINTTADAIALTSNRVQGQVLPFLVPGNAAAGSYNCLKTSGNPKFGICDDSPVTGNFGSMDFFLYGNEDQNTTEKCTGDTNGRLMSNIARGIDHPIGKHPTGTGSGFEEPNLCPIFSAEPDMVQTQPGSASALEDGIIWGGNSYSADGSSYFGRLWDPSGYVVRLAKPSGTPVATRLNDQPLWSHLKPALPAPCNSVSDQPAMVACIDWAKATSTEIFEDSLASAQRFGFTPLVYEATFGGPGTYYHIKDFLPVYLDTTHFSCGPDDCNISHSPGVANSGPCANPGSDGVTCGAPGAWNKGLNALTAYTLSKDIVPGVAKEPYPGATNAREYNLAK